MKQLLQDALDCITKDVTRSAIRQTTNKLRAAIDAPEQEPVAWFELNEDLNAWFLAYGFNPKGKTRPLYTKPVAELTDDEIDDAWRSVDYTVPYEQFKIDIARAVLAAQRGKA